MKLLAIGEESLARPHSITFREIGPMNIDCGVILGQTVSFSSLNIESRHCQVSGLSVLSSPCQLQDLRGEAKRSTLLSVFLSALKPSSATMKSPVAEPFTRPHPGEAPEVSRHRAKANMLVACTSLLQAMC